MILDAVLKLPASYWLILGGIIAVGFAAALLRPNKRKRRTSWRRDSRSEPVHASSSSDPWYRAGPDQVPNWKQDNRPKTQRQVIDTSRWSLELLRALEWKRFEIVCAGYFEAIGFRAHTARAGPDGGVDIHLFSQDATKPGIIVQCKAWNRFPVGIKPIRELFGVMAREGVPEGIFVTTGRFTSEARAFPQGNELHLWDGTELMRKLSELADDRKVVLLRTATDGDFTTPTCPSCAIKMVSRTNRKDQTTFWGCRNYPRCRQRF